MSMQHCKLHAVSVETGRTSSSLLMDVKMHRHHGLKIILKEHSYFHAPCDQNAMRRGPSFLKDINQLLKPWSFKFLSCKKLQCYYEYLHSLLPITAQQAISLVERSIGGKYLSVISVHLYLSAMVGTLTVSAYLTCKNEQA